MQRFWRLALAASIALVGVLVRPADAAAQGITTGAIGGTVTDSAGAPIAGATIRVTNPATGFVRVATTRENGRYIVAGLEIATYRVAAAAIGYGPLAKENIRVQLTQTARADFVMARQAVQLQELVVSGQQSVDFAPTRTGAQTVVSDSLVRRLPTLNRQLQDFVKLTPQVTTNPDPNSAGELSVAGQNSRFNAIQVDGTTQNDRFGLGSTGELGGQAGGRGISLEAVKEYQVVVSPYNVTQGGFTGGLVNAVTKNGTNTLAVTGFYTVRNQDFVPDVPLYAGAEFLRRQYGASVGGPIIKDKLHFFLAGELNESRRPANGPYLGQPSDFSQQLRVNEALITRFNNALAQYGIDGGTAGRVQNENPISNLVARIDYQLSNKSRLVVRNIWNSQEDDDFSRSAATFSLSSNGFRRDEVANSLTAQLFTNFDNGATNEFQVGYIRQRFLRAFDQIGPQVTVVNVPSPVINGAQVNLRAGPDSNSHINQLDQDFFELRNDFTKPVGKNHLVTIGTRSDIYKVRNAFWQNAYGSWRFESLEDLEAGTPFAYGVGVAVGEDEPIARFTAANLAFYIQDQWTVNPNFTVTMGVRAEAPVFFDKPGYLEAAETDFGRRTDEMPSNFTFNPRLGFNWNVGGENRTQVRGGVGLFAGTPPYVWLSNLFTNNGRAGIAQFTCDGQSGRPAAPAFTTANVQNTPQTCSGQGPGVGNNIGFINTIDPNYKQAQVLRATLGFDRDLGWGITGTVDATYTYGINSPFMVNLELNDPVGTDANGRVMYGTLNATGLPTTSVRNGAKYSGGVYDLRNSSGDYAYGVTAGFRKRFTGAWEATAFYSYQRSYSVQDFTSSVARSNFINGRVTSGNQFSTETDPSTFDRPHRITASLTYTAPWKNYPTDISFIYQGQSGTNFTYVYGGGSNRGDLNADGISGNDPIYIPNAASEMVFVQNGNTTPATQAAAFDQLLRDEPCLDAQRGQIMTRGSCRNPWFNSLDLSVRQSLPAIGGHKLTLQADVFNFLNFMNSDWGVYRQNGRFPQITALTVTGRSQDGRPTVQFNPNLQERNLRFPQQLNAVSYWQAQFTLRYAF
ncbi:MAG TPA: carboxypeptidase regulatory-like domain-containing protein [Gemmatimonadales bacterium]|nr:carboxypeptidase regulatory-like domain-containing protein [Gemmatimonadales bacterium]